MKDLDTLLPRLLARVPNASQPAALQALREAAQTFCRRTRLWRETDQFTSSANPDEALMAAPYGAEIVAIELARFADQPLEAVSLSWLDGNVHQWRSLTGSVPNYVTQTAPDTVRLVPAAAGELTLHLWLAPSDRATQLPSWLIDQHGRVLIDGALADLLAMPGKDYTNGDLANYHQGRFERALDSLHSHSIRGQQRAPLRTRAQFL